VGVNRFTAQEAPSIPIQRVDENLERQQIERVRELRRRRDAIRWRTSLDRVTETARTGANLMPAIVEAVESNATVGEIAEALRVVFGEYQESVVI
jgi:methylmalonyl-CoA mutase N-terminal domain/subunit